MMLGLASDLGQREPGFRPRFDVHDTLIEEWFRRILADLFFESPQGAWYGENLCARVALRCHKLYGMDPLPAARSPRKLSRQKLNRVCQYIHDDPAPDLSNLKLARMAGVSVSQFERIFESATDETPHQYVLTSCVEKAKSMLILDPDLKIKAVARETGFASASHLTRVRRSRTGLSPKEFRKAARPRTTVYLSGSARFLQ
jgi:AraC family transcriptional regulator